jgi:hypothetical protein
MRLIKFVVNSGGDILYDFVEFAPGDVPPYAILSHTWGPDRDEVSYNDIMERTPRHWMWKKGSRKLRFCAHRARADDLEYFWVDTCCINKSSSAELSEAINSMYRWYKHSKVCYVYLSDVPCTALDGPGDFTSLADDPKNGLAQFGLPAECRDSFRRSRWFTRGWTLQELIAPPCVEFFSVEGHLIGDKISVAYEIQQLTGIPTRLLGGQSLHQFTRDERLGWTKGRTTKLEEDGAYCLLGLFDVYIPLIYGEGRANAFHRLHAAIDQKLANAPRPPNDTTSFLGTLWLGLRSSVNL